MAHFALKNKTLIAANSIHMTEYNSESNVTNTIVVVSSPESTLDSKTKQLQDIHN